jgi:hypothetical protein
VRNVSRNVVQAVARLRLFLGAAAVIAGPPLFPCSAFQCSAASQETSEPTPSIQGLEQTRDGVTASILRYGFFDIAEADRGLKANYGWGAPALKGRRSFVVRYAVRRAAPLAADGVSGAQNPMPQDSASDNESRRRALQRRDEAGTIRLFAPSGELLVPLGGGGEAGQQQAQWVGVDPRWKNVQLEILALDPAAPLEATGQVEETLRFKGVPVPSRFDRATTVEQTLTTKHGVAVTLESVTMRPGTDERGSRAAPWSSPCAGTRRPR